MVQDPARDVIVTLTSRFDLVSRLADDSRCMRDLRDDLEVSRSTIYKAVRELETAGIVARNRDGVELTPYGRLAYQHYVQFATEIERMARLDTDLPVDGEPSLSPAAFRGAEVVSSEPHDPDRPIDVFEELVDDADRFRGFSPVARSRYVDLFREEVTEGDMEATVVTEQRVVELLLSEHGEAAENVIAADGLEFMQTDDSLPFGLACLGEPVECVVVAVYDERRQIVAILVSESPEAIDWGMSAFETVREDAIPLEPESPTA